MKKYNVTITEDHIRAIVALIMTVRIVGVEKCDSILRIKGLGGINTPASMALGLDAAQDLSSAVGTKLNIKDSASIQQQLRQAGLPALIIEPVKEH